MTSPQPAGSPQSPGDKALAGAIATEHATIYGYGFVSAHCAPEVNELVSVSVAAHRGRRDQATAMLAQRSVTAPVAAAGYQLPMPVNTPQDAARLAVQLEDDTAVSWRAVIEQADTSQDRAFGVTALKQTAALAARWRQMVPVWPVTRAFPGGTE